LLNEVCNLLTQDGQTPLMIAMSQEHEHTVQVLLESSS